MTDDIAVRRRRALYRAQHRGTKEMDWLLGRYASAVLPDMDAASLDRFEQLLAISDVELHKWIIAPDALVDTAFEADIYAIRRFHDLKFATN
jgi:antitoxin CptB